MPNIQELSIYEGKIQLGIHNSQNKVSNILIGQFSYSKMLAHSRKMKHYKAYIVIVHI